jgi:hypothetical protein
MGARRGRPQPKQVEQEQTEITEKKQGEAKMGIENF